MQWGITEIRCNLSCYLGNGSVFLTSSCDILKSIYVSLKLKCFLVSKFASQDIR